MAKHPRLHKRKGSDNYYFRAKVPADIREAFGKSEVCFSLKTSNYREALERVRIESIKFDQECAEKRRQRDAEEIQTLSEVEVERIKSIWLHEALKADEEGRMYGLVSSEYESWEEAVSLAYIDARDDLAMARVHSVRCHLDSLLDELGMKIMHGSEAYHQLSYALLKAKVEALEAIKARHDGKVVQTPPKPAVPFIPPVASDGESSPTITQVHAMWAKEHKASGGVERTVDEFMTYVKRFVELHGDMPVSQITKSHVRQFKDAMLCIPRRPSKKFSGMTVPQLIEYVREHPQTPVLSPRTVNDKALVAIGAVLGWAVENGYLEANPASRVKVKSGKVKKTVRLPYTVDDLNTILSFPIFTDGERPKGGAGEAAKWLPVLAMFTGARLEELGQLTADDIKQDVGIYYLDMTTLDDTKRRKTESSKRRVPIHSTLLDLGFLAYVEERRKQDGISAALFPLLVVNSGKRSSAWSQWWGRYARKHGGFDKLKVFHSFRHTFKDGLREGGVHEEVSDALTGHAPTTEGRKYGGNAYPLKRLKEGIEKLSYPGLEVGRLKL